MTELLRFADITDYFEMGLADQERSEASGLGDAYLTIQVQSAGFVGHNDLWVSAESIQAFCSALVRLERERRGEAVIESTVEGELLLKVASVSRSGQMAVSGITGYEVQRSNTLQWHAVHFGFEFDPSQLVKAVAIDWIAANAGTDGATRTSST